ncbi:MAG TPA: dihydrolipoamide acetyltransferase family protein [Dehalococcoidia bacterium]
MPQMGFDMKEGKVVSWRKREGDQVQEGEIIADIETDKAVVEMEAFASGVLGRIVVPEGETVPVGTVIAYLVEPGEAPPSGAPPEPARVQPAPAPAAERGEPPQSPGAVEQEYGRQGREVAEAPARDFPEREAPAPARAEARPSAPPQPAAAERLRVTPVARRIAEEHGIDLRSVQGTGPEGRITRKDVEAALERQRAGVAAPPQPEAAPAAAAPERPALPVREGPPGRPQPLTRMRETIARRMSLAKQQIPHYYLTMDVDMTAAMALREQINASGAAPTRVSVNDLIVKAVAKVLEQYPAFNASYTEEGIVHHPRINVCIAIALEDGLIAPCVLDTNHKTIGQIAEEAKDLVERARGGRLRPEELTEGTFTVTNLGAWGVETLIGIIQPPQSAILGVGQVAPQPVVRDGEIKVAQMMKVALSGDHRVTDGAVGAQFLGELRDTLQNPWRLLV